MLHQYCKHCGKEDGEAANAVIDAPRHCVVVAAAGKRLDAELAREEYKGLHVRALKRGKGI